MISLSIETIATSIYGLNATKANLEYQINHLKNMIPADANIRATIDLLEHQLFDVVAAVNELENIYCSLEDSPEQPLPEHETIFSLESMKNGLNKPLNAFKNSDGLDIN